MAGDAGNPYPLFTQRPNGDLYNWALTMAERRRTRIYDPSFGLASDAHVYEKLLRIPTIKHGVVQRASQVSGKDWTTVPATSRSEDVRLAHVMNDLIAEIGHFDAARFRLAHSFFYGSTYEEMRGDFERVRLTHDDKSRRWFVVREMKNVDKRRFTRWRGFEGGDPERSEWVMWDTRKSRWARVTDPDRFVKHVYDDREQMLGFGTGLVDSLFWAAYALSEAETQGLSGLERWAQGWIVAKVGEERAGSTDRTNDDVVSRWVDKLRNQRSHHVLVHGAQDQIEVHETSGSGHAIVVDFCNMIKTDITRLILGSQRPTGGGGEGASGARAQASVEAESTEAVIQYDQGELDECISHDLIGYLWRMNRPIFVEMGLGSARLPKFQSVKQRIEDPEVNSRVVETLLRAGVPLVEEEVYAKAGFRVPRANERVIEPRPAPQVGGLPL